MTNPSDTGCGLRVAPKAVVCVVLALLAVAVVAYLGRGLLPYGDVFWLLNLRIHRDLDKISIGSTVDEVRNALGTPAEIFQKEDSETDYYVDGWAYKERPITNQVWVYFGDFDAIAYVYLDEEMRVEEVFSGGS